MSIPQEAIEAAAKAEWARHGPSMPHMTWETEYADYKNYLRASAEAALEAAAPYLIRELALKQMVSMPWFEELVMAEALAYHSGGNCRFESEARAAELEAAADRIPTVMVPTHADWLRSCAAAIRASEGIELVRAVHERKEAE